MRPAYSLDHVIGTSDSFQEVLGVISRVAPTDANVILSGEPGTGKELTARAIHANSRRFPGPFIAINCAVLPENLLDYELFGSQGEYCSPRTEGLLVAASGGTIFLEEITAISPELQARLLRVIETRSIHCARRDTEIPVNVRWIAATTLDLAQAVLDGVLRRDLLRALDAVPLRLPPLRDRREDVPELARHFLRHLAQEYDRQDAYFSEETLRMLTEYDWPGNVRELRDVMEHAVLLRRRSTQEILPDHLPQEVTRTGSAPDGAHSGVERRAPFRVGEEGSHR